MTSDPENPAYLYRSAEPSGAHTYLWPEVRERLKRTPPGGRVLDFGCGNGTTANMLTELGYEVIGVDRSESGIAVARSAFPRALFHLGSVYDDLSPTIGTFDAVISLEVIEHLYAPRAFLHTFRSLLRPGGIGIISTPYHGYLKNLAIALTGHFDEHVSALWDGGHVKFWSIHTLGTLLLEQGFVQPVFTRVGRIPALAKSMIVTFSAPIA